jgi:hypothetical protein
MTRQNKQRRAWTQQRVDQAYAAAENGDGWTDLGRLWGDMSSSGALMWCRNHVPLSVMHQIGRNGLANLKNAHQHKGRRYEFEKPRMLEHRFGASEVNQACRKITYRDGGIFECGAETDGTTYCRPCAKHLITLTDRVPVHSQAAEAA